MSRTSEELRQELIEILNEVAEITNAECRACEPPLSCCHRDTCEYTINHAQASWGIRLRRTGHPDYPLMGEEECIAAPHLRPICALYTCSVEKFGRLKDSSMDSRYQDLRVRALQLSRELGIG